MGRLFGTVLIFGGWLCICGGAFFGLAASEFLGLSHTEGPVAPFAVYGISAAVVLWIFVIAAVLSAFPLAMAVVAIDPRRRLGAMATVMIGAAIVLIPDPLGRSFGVPLVPGAGLIAAAGVLIYRDSPILVGIANKREIVDGGTPAEPATAQSGPPAWGSASAGEGTASAPSVPTTAVLASAVAVPTAVAPSAIAGRRGKRKKDQPAERECPWCSARVPAGEAECPSCHATVDAAGVDTLSVPGLTEVSPGLRAYAEKVRAGKAKRNLLTFMMSSPSDSSTTNVPNPSEPAALLPPSSAVRAEMARIDAEIAAGLGLPVADTPAAEPEPVAEEPGQEATDEEGRGTEPAAEVVVATPADPAPPRPRRRVKPA